MSNFLTSTSTEVRRIHKNFTKELTVYNYSWNDSGGSNEYADGDWSTSVSTVQASVRLPEDIKYEDDAAGSETDHDVDIWVSPDEINLTIANGDEERATEFEDENGRKYRAVGFHDETSLYRVMCREVTK